MNIDEIYKMLEQREEKILKQLTMELDKFSEKITSNLRLLVAENDKLNTDKINEIKEKVNNINYRCDEMERNCVKCENFKIDIRRRVEEIETTKHTATGMGILIKVILTSGLIALIFSAGQFYNNSINNNASVPTHIQK